MAVQRLKFTEWLPDQPANSGALLDAKNVYPVSMGYAPFNNAKNYSGSATENLNKIFVSKYGDLVQAFAGGSTKLFKLDNTDLSLDDVSKSGGYSSTDAWNFTQFGKVILAANNSSKIQSWTLGTSTAFADVDTNAPIAKYVTVVRDFVFAAHLTSSFPSTVQWSDANDETLWVSGGTSQSDSQVLPDGGSITGLSGGEIGIIFLEKAIYRASYIGSPFYWQFDVISRGLGCIEGNSIAQYGATSFFLADDGFYKTDGTIVEQIGTEKVDRYFFNDCRLTEIKDITAAVDPVKKLVVWNYPNVDGGRSILIYNWQLNKWSRATTDSTVVGNLATVGVTLEALETQLGYTNIDTMPASLDDRLFVGGRFLFAGAKDDTIVTFTGSTYNSELITGDIELGYNTVINLVKPQIDNGSANIKIASRRELDDNIAFGTSVTTTSEGRANVRAAGRYHRVSVSPTGNWTTAVGLDLEVKQQGTR
jgi:hypothetical protein